MGQAGRASTARALASGRDYAGGTVTQHQRSTRGINWLVGRRPAMLGLVLIPVVLIPTNPAVLASSRAQTFAAVSSGVIHIAPRVSPVGTTVTAYGTCTSSPRFQVIGQPAGWFDIPPKYVDVVLDVDRAGSWFTEFPMPSLPSSVVLSCPDGPMPAVPIAPSFDSPPGIAAQRDADGYIVDVQKVSQPDALEVFTASGEPVASTELLRLPIGEGWSVTLHVAPDWPNSQVVVLGFEALGENANANQVTRVQAWSRALSPSPVSAAVAAKQAVRLPPGSYPPD